MRLDNYLVNIGLFDSRTKSKRAIENGEIYINSALVTKPSYEILDVDTVSVERVCQSDYVSIGGFKLEKALKDFAFRVDDLVIADVGASTGGFTDCLLQNGAKKVFAVDLRDDLLHEKLKNDDKVELIVKNARDLVLDDFSLPLDMIVVDLSFISLSMVISVLSKLLVNGKKLILLIKPQFEVGKKIKLKNGILRDSTMHKNICKNVYLECIKHDFAPLKITKAPEVVNKNLEFLLLLEKGGKAQEIDSFINCL